MATVTGVAFADMKATKARRGAGRTAGGDSADDLFPSRREAGPGSPRSSARKPARRASAPSAPDPVGPGAGPSSPGLWPGVSADGEVPTEVPRIDDVLRAPLRGPAGSPQPHTHARSAGAGAGRTPVSVNVRGGAERVAAVKRGAARRIGRARPVRGVWGRPPMLVATAAVAMLAGVASGLGYGFLSGPDVEDDAVPPATQQACAVTQVAWATSANAQVGMSAEKPETLVRGFLGSREALAGVQPPPAIAADWNTVVGYVDEVAKAVESVEDDSQIEGAVVSALGRLDTAEMTEAAERITTYLKAGCDL